MSMLAVLVIAHAGHWAVSLIYAAPAVLLLGAVSASTVRQRKRDQRRAAPDRHERP